MLNHDDCVAFSKVIICFNVFVAGVMTEAVSLRS